MKDLNFPSLIKNLFKHEVLGKCPFCSMLEYPPVSVPYLPLDPREIEDNLEHNPLEAAHIIDKELIKKHLEHFQGGTNHWNGVGSCAVHNELRKSSPFGLGILRNVAQAWYDKGFSSVAIKLLLYALVDMIHQQRYCDDNLRRDIIDILLDLSYYFRDINFHRASLACIRLALQIKRSIVVVVSSEDDDFRIAAYLHAHYVDRGRYDIAKEVYIRFLKDFHQVDGLQYRDMTSWRNAISYIEDMHQAMAAFDQANNLIQKIREQTEGPIRIKYIDGTYRLLSNDKREKERGVKIIADLEAVAKFVKA